jgi:hypothetical protein
MYSSSIASSEEMSNSTAFSHDEKGKLCSNTCFAMGLTSSFGNVIALVIATSTGQ